MSSCAVLRNLRDQGIAYVVAERQPQGSGMICCVFENCWVLQSYIRRFRRLKGTTTSASRKFSDEFFHFILSPMSFRYFF